MRSLQRKSWPQNPDGTTKAPAHYKTFLSDLIDNFGRYCCYCEIRARSLDVEHISPKSLNSSYTCNWFNLLLACPTCNRDYKKNKNTSRGGLIWPDDSDTFDMFVYHDDGSMTVNSSLHPRVQTCAQNTIDIMCLNPQNYKNNDICNIRREQWDIANDLLADYEQNLLSVDRIVKNVVANGYWSVWMTVFKDHPEVTQKIADAFPGTLPKYCTP